MNESDEKSSPSACAKSARTIVLTIGHEVRSQGLKMVVAHELQRFPENQRVLATRTARSMLSMTRFRPAIPPGDSYAVRMEAEDAFVVVFRLRSLPAHEFGIGGKVERTAPAQRSTLKIVNLGDGDAYCLHFAPFDTLVIHVPRSALDDVADATGTSKIDVLKAPDPWRTRDSVFDQIYPLLLNALSDGETVNRLLYDHWLLGLATHVAYRYGGVAPKDRLVRGGLAPWQERRVKELLSDCMAEAVSLGEIASECQLSSDYLSRAFKLSTGLTPHQWLQAHRVDRAKHMLATTSLPIAEIARSCGFSDQSHLCRIFSRHTGSSPGAWRKQA